MYRRADGIVDFDKSVCIGCKACIAACPYDAIFINPHDSGAEKCNFCAHRLDVGLEPACVTVCPAEAILVGDLNDPGSHVARIVGREPVSVRRPEKDTRPKLFYKGAHAATLDPLGARRPDGGLFMWSEQGQVPHQVPSGHPGTGTSAAAAILAYDVPHRAPWDFKVSLYTWTKGIAAGAWLVPLLLLFAGQLAREGPLWQWIAPLTAGIFLAATLLLLLLDLDRPARFFLIFMRPQWQSWLTRGAVILTAYAALLGLHLAASALVLPGLQRAVELPGLVIAALSAVYTAYLFAQAKARDLWQSALLPAQIALQALLAGSALLLLLAPWFEGSPRPVLALLTGVLSAIHLLLVAGEVTLTHATAHARLAVREMTTGRYARFFWAGVTLMAAGVAAPWWGAPAAALALAGLLAYEHAYVQSAQAVPLA
jgi:formate-dependent nitrite reductase membrane component NrfD/ferredoxin